MPAPRLMLILALICVPLAFADDSGNMPVAGDAATTPPVDVPPAENAPLSVLVSSTGRVFEGAISETPGGYRVTTNIGVVTLPFDQVACTATSLRDAHSKLQQLCMPPSAGGHILLSRWCMENRLYDLAMDEVNAALVLEPSRAEARQLLAQLQTVLNPQPAAEQNDNLYSWDDMLAPPVPPPGGLTRETTHQFVRRVQPLILNSCANARCHGNPQASFHLEYVPSSGVGSQSITTENIERVYQFIDIDRPQESRLFTALNDSEISEHRQVLNGPRGREQLELIAAWIMQGSLERGGRPQIDEAVPVQVIADVTSTVADDVQLTAATDHMPAASAISHVPMTLDNAPPISIEALSPRDTTLSPETEAPSRSPALTPVAPPPLLLTPRIRPGEDNEGIRDSSGR